MRYTNGNKKENFVQYHQTLGKCKIKSNRYIPHIKMDKIILTIPNRGGETTKILIHF